AEEVEDPAEVDAASAELAEHPGPHGSRVVELALASLGRHRWMTVLEVHVRGPVPVPPQAVEREAAVVRYAAAVGVVAGVEDQVDKARLRLSQEGVDLSRGLDERRTVVVE